MITMMNGWGVDFLLYYCFIFLFPRFCTWFNLVRERMHLFWPRNTHQGVYESWGGYQSFRTQLGRFVGLCSLGQRAYTRNDSFENLYGGQFTLSTQLIKPNYLDLEQRIGPQIASDSSPGNLKTVVTILENFPLSYSEKSALSRGLNVFPFPKTRRIFS